MPIYEYQCNKCGNVFEVLQKFSDAPVKKHEKCGGKVHKLISKSGFQLKGGGWYATDYAKSGSVKEDKSSAKEETKSEASSTDSKSTETKSETKTESKPTESKTDSKPASKAKKN